MNSDWFTFLAGQNAHIESDCVQHFGHPAEELAHTEVDTVLTDLSHLGLIRFSGEDAHSFLQGQLSCDLRTVTSDIATHGGYCTPKGRLLSNFLIWQDLSGEGYLMQLPLERVDAVIKRLRMFVLRAKVTLQDESKNLVRFGIAGQKARQLLQASLPHITIPTQPLRWTPIPDGQLLCHNIQRFECITTPAHASSLWTRIHEQAHCAGAKCWEWLEISEGIPSIQAATQEQFVPQMINLDIIGGVSFKKGCYPGQEIVARTQYLGRLKRRMYRAHIDSPSIVAAGNDLFSADTQNQACGMIVRAAPSPAGGYDVLAVIQISSAQASTIIHWQHPDGPQLALLPLPYPLPPS
ncbi:YgfZ/GcvT domain-containing protein [Nitrosomonas sp. ANs5]|uniref:CAF17-like 4Fe-4S cluster assembly/insertion protein YgfZ n=1 Tax=Nitrosomonas sp. ANs5 TaxID=3423941 RepID=UPI003D344002